MYIGIIFIEEEIYFSIKFMIKQKVGLATLHCQVRINGDSTSSIVQQ